MINSRIQIFNLKVRLLKIIQKLFLLIFAFSLVFFESCLDLFVEILTYFDNYLDLMTLFDELMSFNFTIFDFSPVFLCLLQHIVNLLHQYFVLFFFSVENGNLFGQLYFDLAVFLIVRFVFVDEGQ